MIAACYKCRDHHSRLLHFTTLCFSHLATSPEINSLHPQVLRKSNLSPDFRRKDSWCTLVTKLSAQRALLGSRFHLYHALYRAGGATTGTQSRGKRRRDTTDLQISHRESGDHYGLPFGHIDVTQNHLDRFPNDCDDASFNVDDAESQPRPRLALVNGISDEIAESVMTMLGIHAPECGSIGKALKVIVLERGSVITAHMETNPVSVTYVPVSGKLLVFSWGCDPGSPLIGLSDYTHDFLSEASCPTAESFHELHPGITPLLYEVQPGQALALRAGSFHLVTATADSGESRHQRFFFSLLVQNFENAMSQNDTMISYITVVCKATSNNLLDGQHVVRLYRALESSPTRASPLDPRCALTRRCLLFSMLYGVK